MWEAKDIEWIDKALLTEISFLDDGDGCRASRSYLARLFNCSTEAIKQRLSRLRSLGYILDRGFDGKTWIISVKHNPSGNVQPIVSSNTGVTPCETAAVTPVLPLEFEKTADKTSQPIVNEAVEESLRKSVRSEEDSTIREESINSIGKVTKRDSSELIRINSSESPRASRHVKLNRDDLVKLYEVWRAETNGGLVGFGRLGRACRPLILEYGLEEVIKTLRRYLESEMKTGLRYASPEGFASKFGAFRGLPDDSGNWSQKMESL